MFRALLSLSICFASLTVSAASIGSDDWMQPQTIVIRATPDSRIHFDFCPTNQRVSKDECRPLGGRQTGFTSQELRQLGRTTSQNSRFWRYARPMSQMMLSLSGGLLMTGGGLIGVVTGGALWSVGESIGKDPSFDSSRLDQLSRTLAPSLARPRASFRWDLDILSFAKELDSTLRTLGLAQVTCECRSTYSAHSALQLPTVTGRGGETWQARMNAQALCRDEITAATNRTPTFDSPPALTNCAESSL